MWLSLTNNLSHPFTHNGFDSIAWNLLHIDQDFKKMEEYFTQRSIEKLTALVGTSKLLFN
jgi:hypothetical protein